MSTRPIELSIILPTYNEKENLLILIPALTEALRPVPHEILVVDDDSPDGTRETALAMASQGHAVRVITKKKKEGIGAALRVGYDAAIGRLVASSDADLSFEPQDLLRLKQKIDDGADMVVGNRHAGRGLYEASRLSIKIKHWVSVNGNRLLRISTGIPIGDFSANFRMFRREVWTAIQTQENTNTLLFEMILKAWLGGYRVCDLPVTFKDRRFGQSKLRLSLEAPKFLIRLIGYLCRYGQALRHRRRTGSQKRFESQ